MEEMDGVEEAEVVVVEVVAKSLREMRLDVLYDQIMLLYDLTYNALFVSLYMAS